MVLNKITVTALVILVGQLAFPGDAFPLPNRLEDAYENVLSKNGIEIGGEINAEYLNSGLSGSARIDTNYANETTQFTSFDLDMHYRPYDFLGARAQFRFYQDWQTFFSTRSRILASRWLSVDGNLANTLGFNAGDFKQKYTPLTLWAPELDLIYEPLIFSRPRAELMEEQFLGGNNRVLQGLNFNMAKRFDLPVSEFRADAIGSRLRRAEFLDPDGRHGYGLSRSDMDRFFLALNSQILVRDNLLLGGSFLSIFDDRDSYELIPYGPVVYNSVYPDGVHDGRSLNGMDSVIARDLRIFGGHGGADIAGFLGVSEVTLEILGEFATSGEFNRYAWRFKKESVDGIPRNVEIEATAPGKDGTALNLELGAGYQPRDGAYGIFLTAHYLRNDASFLNPMAQSPTFIGERVLNTENDFATSQLYSTLDALNNGVYKFSPSRRTASNQHAPFTKTSYNRAVLSPEDLSRVHLDPVLQLALPFGLATPDRAGFKARIRGHWASTLHASMDAVKLEEIEGNPIDGIPTLASFTQIGAGLKLELDKSLGLNLPLDVSASYARNQSTRGSIGTDLGSPDVTADFLMAGCYYRFFRKWALLGGVQQATLESTLRNQETSVPAQQVVHQYSRAETQRHYRGGLEYALGENAYLVVSGGMIDVERTTTHLGSAQTGAETNADPAKNRRTDFSQLLTQLVINVKF